MDADVTTRDQQAGRPFPTVLPRIVCADGYQLSVQASSSHYCTPRADWPEAGWTHVEVMANDAPADWDQYDSGGVYGWVPMEKVAAFIRSHGGIKLRRLHLPELEG